VAIIVASAIAAVHKPLVQNGNLGDAYRAGTFGCCQLITKVALADCWGTKRETSITIDLAARTVNSCGAGGLLALSGYWAAAAHQLRDLVECHQLFEYFRAQPEAIAPWFEARGSARYPRFSVGTIKKKLDGDRGRPSNFDLQSGFSFASNAGSHPSFEGLAWHAIRPRVDCGCYSSGGIPHRWAPSHHRIWRTAQCRTPDAHPGCRPAASAGLIAAELKISQRPALGRVAELGIREVTGRARYRAWGIL